MKANNQLQPGAYALPPDCKATVRGGQVIVTIKKRTLIKSVRCRDCKFFEHGYATSGAWNKVTVCKARPKVVNYRSERTREEGVYYAALARNRACGKFELKTPEQ